MTLEAQMMTVSAEEVLQRLDWIVAEVSAMREELTRLPSAAVVEQAQQVNTAINDPTLNLEERMEVVNSVPAPLRHAVAAECYRTNENITFGWVASIAGIFTWEVPDLLRVFDVEPDERPLTAEEMSEQVALIEQHRHDSTRQ